MIAVKNTIQCTQCGGTASPVPGKEYLQCDYCLSLVFSVDNPLAVDRITPTGETLNASCPTCDVALSTGKIEQQPVLYCGQCCGILMKNSVFGSVVRQRRARRVGVESEASKPLDTSAYDRQICCPACDRGMEVHPYYGPGNVVMDSCAACEYVWLDHGELRSVEVAEGTKHEEDPPVYVDGDGQLVVIPVAQEEEPVKVRSPFAALVDAFWGI